jgi:hypothetical protein
MGKKNCITLAKLRCYNHMDGAIERGIEIYNGERIVFKEQNKNEKQYYAQLPQETWEDPVFIQFSHNLQDVIDYFCHCSLGKSGNPMCCHVVATVLAIQGGIPTQ